MRISYKLIASYMAIAVVIAFLGLYYHRTGSAIQRRLGSVKNVAIVGIVDANTMNASLRRAHVLVYRHLVQQQFDASLNQEAATTEEMIAVEVERELQRFDRSLERSRQSSAPVQSAVSTPDSEESWRRLRETFEVHRRLLRGVLAHSAEDPIATLERFEDIVRPHFQRELLPLIDAYEQQAEKEFALSTRAIEEQLTSNQYRSAFWSIFAAGIALGIGLWMARQIVTPLKRLRAASHEIGRGNLASTVNIATRDEFGVLGAAFNQMRDQLQITMVSRDRLEAALQEKEVLLREVHHRVKNNLQIISSFLRLQAAAAGEPKVERLLKETQGRVHAMARIHEQLHESDDLANVEMQHFVEGLSRDLLRSYADEQGAVQLEVNADTVYLPLDVAIPCGMILNELISNSLKHAIPDDGAARKIAVVYRVAAKAHTLGVRDNGRSFTGRLEAGRSDSSLGMSVVQALAKQLQGTLEVDTDVGTSIMVTYPRSEGDSGRHE